MVGQSDYWNSGALIIYDDGKNRNSNWKIRINVYVIPFGTFCK